MQSPFPVGFHFFHGANCLILWIDQYHGFAGGAQFLSRPRSAFVGNGHVKVGLRNQSQMFRAPVDWPSVLRNVLS